MTEMKVAAFSLWELTEDGRRFVQMFLDERRAYDEADHYEELDAITGKKSHYMVEEVRV